MTNQMVRGSDPVADPLTGAELGMEGSAGKS
jgi:hypothetical protein